MWEEESEEWEQREEEQEQEEEWEGKIRVNGGRRRTW